MKQSSARKPIEIIINQSLTLLLRKKVRVKACILPKNVVSLHRQSKEQPFVPCSGLLLRPARVINDGRRWSSMKTPKRQELGILGSCLKKQKFEQEENNMITVDGLTVEFGGTTLFKDISFQINEKDRIALMGKNGAGKSTLLKIIAGVRNATTNSWNLRRWKIFRNWRRNNNPYSIVFLSKIFEA